MISLRTTRVIALTIGFFLILPIISMPALYVRASAGGLDTIRFAAPFVSQIDPNWASEYMIAPYTVDGGTMYLPYPDMRTYGSGGCFLSAMSMALQFFHQYPSHLGHAPLPPGVNEFLAETGGMIESPSGEVFYLDYGKLESWYWVFVSPPGLTLWNGIETETLTWPLGQLDLDNYLLEVQEIMQGTGYIPPPGFIDRIPMIIIRYEYDLNDNGVIENNVWIDWNGNGVVDVGEMEDESGRRHALVVTGWDSFDESYIVHDPGVTDDIMMWNYIYANPGEPVHFTNFWSLYVPSYLTLHDLYYGHPWDVNNYVQPGALNLIEAVIWLKDSMGSTPALSFDVIMGSPAELFVSDPDGNRVGIDPVTGARLEEADAYYYTQGMSALFDMSGLESFKVVKFPRPKEGKYLIQVVGTGDGAFELFFNKGGEGFSGQISEGEILKFEVDYSPDDVSAQETSNFLPTARVVMDTGSLSTDVPVFFSGLTSSDFDGQIVSYHWDFGDGTESSGTSVEHAYTTPGSFTVTLTVEDDLGGTATDTVDVTVTAPPPPWEPQPPSVAIAQKGWAGIITTQAPFLGLASTDPSNIAHIRFWALGTDPNDGDPSTWTWTWDFGDGSDPVETLYFPGWPLGTSGVVHEYASNGTYTVSVVFNNGIEDSPPATATVEILPALDRDAGFLSIVGSCFSPDSEIHVTGRTNYTRVYGQYAGLEALWEGGFALGSKPLEEWLKKGSYYFMIFNREEDLIWVVLGYLQPGLPDLCFDYTFPLPTDPFGNPLPDGEYVAVFAPAEDLKYEAADWDPNEFPLILYDKPSIEGDESWTRIPFTIPCPGPANYKPVADANGPYEGTVGQPITLDGTGSYDPDGNDDALQFQWFIPDQDPLEGPSPQVVFDESGTYIVSLVVEDEEGAITFPTIGSPGSFAVVIVTEEVLIVETTDETGEIKDVFDISETVYVIGSGYSPSTIYDLYLVEDTMWSGGMDIPDRVSGTETSVTTDENGNIPAGTVAWNGPLTPGRYDIVIDVNGNTKYDEGIDAIDDDDIKVTAGFFVIPELPLGTVTALLSALVALTLFKKRSVARFFRKIPS